MSNQRNHNRPDESRKPLPRPRFKDRIVELRRVRASELLPNPKNWRRHPEAQRSALRALLTEVGYADALIAREDPQGRLVLIDGHLRRSLDARFEVPVLVVDLDQEEADKVLASLDPLAALAEPDPGALAELLASVHTEHRALQDLLDGLARTAGLGVPGLRDPEDIPELPASPRTQPGDLISMGEHRLLCGDASDPDHLVRLMAGERADLLWTDPPYGVDYTGKTRAALKIRNDQARGLDGLLRGAFDAIDPVLRAGAALYVCHPAGALSVTFGIRFLAQGWRLHQTLVWEKDSPVLGHCDYHYVHEPVAFGYKPGPGRWGHPTASGRWWRRWRAGPWPGPGSGRCPAGWSADHVC